MGTSLGYGWPRGVFFLLKPILNSGCPRIITLKKKMIKILFIWLTGISFFDVIGVAIKAKVLLGRKV